MLLSSTAANSFSKDHGLERNYYYHRTHNVKLFLSFGTLLLLWVAFGLQYAATFCHRPLI